jgi:hypothetical protein
MKLESRQGPLYAELKVNIIRTHNAVRNMLSSREENNVRFYF